MLKPGNLLDDGRYRLVDPYGADERAGLEFWRAHDTRLRRDVALTLLAGDANDTAAVHGARMMTAGARRGRSEHPALARVLDVLGPDDMLAHEGVLCLVVAEWTDGTDLRDIVADGPVTPLAACRVLRPLVAATDDVHHHGLVLGLESGGPGRIRINGQGMATLAFAGAAPTATTRQDVRGLGALLYLLLTGASAGTTSPHRVPRELSLIAMLSLDDTSVGGIRTCGPLLSVLDRVIQSETSATGPVEPVPAAAPPRPPASPRPPLEALTTEIPVVPEPTEILSGHLLPVEPPASTKTAARPRTEPPPDRTRPRIAGRRRLTALTAVLSVGAIALAVWIGTQIAGFFHESSSAAQGSIAVTRPTTTPDTNPQRIIRPTTTVAPPPTTTVPPPVPIAPAGVVEYMVSGSPDSPDKIGRVVDGDPNSGWSTAQYNQQLPAFIPGIGIMITFPRPEQVDTVTIDSPSPGPVVQIRSANAPDTPIGNTPVIGQATLNAGTTTIPIPPGAPTTNLLVWITQLGNSGGGYTTAINEITCLGTP